MTSSVDPQFWRGKRVFVTGHTGFKGSWLSVWLQSMGAVVKGYALPPPTDPALFNEAKVARCIESEIGDVRDIDALRRSVDAFHPEILIHMAAQPLVRLSYREPVETYLTNVMGTVNVLEVARRCPTLRAIVNVTTDKCYENREWVWGYREDEPMGGFDPYSSSKGCAELVTSAFRRSYFSEAEAPAVASARAGNVIGGGDWAEDRLIPDIMRAFEAGGPVIVRNPSATRPWQHVLEPLSGYLILAQKLYFGGQQFAEAWNFGPREQDVKSVESILEFMVLKWGSVASWELEKDAQPHEASLLRLDISKAHSKLGWQPKWSVEDALDQVIDWQRHWLAGHNIREKTLEQIHKYQNAH